MKAGERSRREFLGASAAMAAAAWVSGGCVARLTERGTVVDTHTHFYDPRRPQGVPWPPRDDAFLYRPVLPPEHRRMAEPLGITGTIVVEASPWVEDNDWVLDLAGADGWIMGLVGHLKPGTPEFRVQLERLGRRRGFLGIRTGLWGVSFAPEDEAFMGDLRRLAAAGMSLDLLIPPEQLGMAARLAARIPELRVIIDHCANVRIDGGAPPEDWREGIREVAKHRGVFMKVSGLVEGTGRSDGGAPRDTDYYRPVLDEIWEVFGEDRVIYGSNWPVSARFASLADLTRIVREYAESRGATAAEQYFSGNAARAYRYERRAAARRMKNQAVSMP